MTKHCVPSFGHYFNINYKYCDIKMETIVSSTTSYQVMNFLGKGIQGQVNRCLDKTTGDMVAIKRKISTSDIFQREVKILEALRALDPDKKNIVKFIEHFRFMDFSCLVFEMLDRSIRDLMKEREGNPLRLNEIRPVTQQLLVAFEAIHNIGILHADLKPDNIMLVDHPSQPFKIKLIDFGVAIPIKYARRGITIQAPAYRAPEVILGLPLTGAVDMWALGCTVAYMYFGKSLFPYACPYWCLRAITQLRGAIKEALLCEGIHTSKYFTWDKEKGWRIKRPKMYEDTNQVKLQYKRLETSFKTLEDGVKIYSPTGNPFEMTEQTEFLHFLECLLCVDYKERFSATEALQNAFITKTENCRRIGSIGKLRRMKKRV